MNDDYESFRTMLSDRLEDIRGQEITAVGLGGTPEHEDIVIELSNGRTLQITADSFFRSKVSRRMKIGEYTVRESDANLKGKTWYNYTVRKGPRCPKCAGHIFKSGRYIGCTECGTLFRITNYYE